MAILKVDQVGGLVTAPNELQVDGGALVESTNTVIRAPGVIEPRKGIRDLGTDNFGGSQPGQSLMWYGDTNIVSVDGDTLWRREGLVTTQYSGTYVPADNTLLRMKGSQAGKNFYFTTSRGVYALDSAAGTPVRAGIPQPPDLYPVTTGASGLAGNPDAAGSWLPPNSSVSFRVVWGFYDANENFKLSAPSGRFIVKNPANQVNASTAYVNLSTTKTVTTATAHGLTPGDTISITASSTTQIVASTPTTVTVATTPSTTTFTFAGASATASSTGTISYTSGNKQVTFTMQNYDSELTTSHFYRIYRTIATTNWTSDPGEEHYLVRESYFTAADLSSGAQTITITEPNAVVGPFLYTNPNSGQGAVDANDRPPLCTDITNWSDREWFANTEQIETLQISLIGVDAPNGLQFGDYVIISDTQCEASTAIYTNGTPSQNIEVSARGIVARINQNVKDITGYEDIKAYYIGGPSTGIGNMLFKRYHVEQSKFSWGTNRPTAFNPQINPANAQLISIGGLVRMDATTIRGTTGGAHGWTIGQTVVVATAATSPDDAAELGQGRFVITAVPTSTTFEYTFAGVNVGYANLYQAYAYKYDELYASENDAGPNRLYYSKLGEPEACPIANYLDIGAANKKILRIFPQGDQLFVFKEDGLYVVTGQEPFRVDAFDLNCILVGPDTVTSVDNQVYALTTKGVVRINSGGVEIISKPIDNYVMYQLIGLSTTAQSKRLVFAVEDELNQEYVLFMERDFSDTIWRAKNPILFNTTTGTWNQWSMQATHAAFAPVSSTTSQVSNNLLFVGMPSPWGISGVQYQVRDRDQDAYYDQAYTVSISGSTTTTTPRTLIMNCSNTSAVDVGDKISLNNGGGWGLVKEIVTNSRIVVSVDAGASVATGTRNARKSYPVSLKWISATGGDATLMKQFSASTAYFRQYQFYTANFTFDNALQADSQATLQFSDATVTRSFTLLGYVPPKDKRTLVAKDLQQSPYINVGFYMREAMGYVAINGYALEYNNLSGRNSR